jgi:Uma2 family endonuclease
MIIPVAPIKTRGEAAEHRKMSYEEYLEFASDSQIMEWVEGEVIIYMPPLQKHQNISRFLGILLDLFVHFFDLGDIIFAPFEVKLWPDGPSREPDIIFITNENLDILTDKRVEGSPDLLIEITSPSSITEDRIRKFTEYQKAGVREYWVIDPRPYQQQADFYLLGEDKQYHPAPVDQDGRYHSTAIPGFWFKLDWLWSEELPDPQSAFAEIILSSKALPPEVSAAYQTIQKWLASRK